MMMTSGGAGGAARSPAKSAVSCPAGPSASDTESDDSGDWLDGRSDDDDDWQTPSDDDVADDSFGNPSASSSGVSSDPRAPLVGLRANTGAWFEN